MKPCDIAAGKSCGDCGLCCKLIGVESIAKPQFTWCWHFKKTAGCGIYEDRPHDCRAFGRRRRRPPGRADRTEVR